MLAGFSGLRLGEISGLLWSDLELECGFVIVQRTLEEDADGALLEYPPKNGKARVVPLPAAACDELRALHAAQKEYHRLARGRLERGGPRGAQEGRQPDGALDPEEPVNAASAQTPTATALATRRPVGS